MMIYMQQDMGRDMGKGKTQTIMTYVFVILLLIAVAINLFQYKGIDNQANSIYTSISNYGNPDIHYWAYIAEPRFGFLYNMSYDLGKVSDRAVLILPPGYSFVGYYIEEVLFFGNLNRIERLDYDHLDFLEGFDPTPYIVGSNEDEPHFIQYRIALNSNKSLAEEFVFVMWQEDIVLLIDTSLLPESKIVELRELRG